MGRVGVGKRVAKELVGGAGQRGKGRGQIPHSRRLAEMVPPEVLAALAEGSVEAREEKLEGWKW